MRLETSPPSAALDRAGVIASVGCAIHCLAAPVLLVVAPALGGWWVHPGTHLAIAAFVLPVAAMALWRGYAIHGRRSVVVLGGIGMALVVVGVILPFVSSSGGTGPCRDCCPTLMQDTHTGATALRIPPASIVTILGGFALIAAHVRNLRGCCGTCPADAEPRS